MAKQRRRERITTKPKPKKRAKKPAPAKATMPSVPVGKAEPLSAEVTVPEQPRPVETAMRLGEGLCVLGGVHQAILSDDAGDRFKKASAKLQHATEAALAKLRTLPAVANVRKMQSELRRREGVIEGLQLERIEITGAARRDEITEKLAVEKLHEIAKQIDKLRDVPPPETEFMLDETSELRKMKGGIHGVAKPVPMRMVNGEPVRTRGLNQQLNDELRAIADEAIRIRQQLLDSLAKRHATAVAPLLEVMDEHLPAVHALYSELRRVIWVTDEVRDAVLQELEATKPDTDPGIPTVPAWEQLGPQIPELEPVGV